MGMSWTEEEEERFFSLLDRSFVDGQNSLYPKLNFEQIALVMNREATERSDFTRVYTREGLHAHYKVAMARRYVTTAALAEAQLRTAQALDKIVEDAMLRSEDADRQVAEIKTRLTYAAMEHGHDPYTNPPSTPELVDATLAAAAARAFFVAMAEDADTAIKKAKRSFQDAEVTVFLKSQ